MARRLRITDGTTTVNLLDLGTSWQLLPDGWQQADPEQSQIRRSSLFDEGDGLIHSMPRNRFETYQVALEGANHDTVAASLQALASLQKAAREYHTTRWQKTPVYLDAQTSGESNTRYGLIFDFRVSLGQSLYGRMFDTYKFIEPITITVEREPFWRGTIPQTLPGSALTLGAPQAPGTQVDATEQFLANFRDTSALTHVYNYDDSVTTNLISRWKLDEASGNAIDAHGTNDLTDTNTVTAAAAKLGAGSRQFTSANSEYFTIADNASLSTGDIDFSIACWVYLDTKSADMYAVAKFGTAGNREYRLGYLTASDRFIFTVSNDGTATANVVANNFGAVSTGTWYFIVAYHDSVNNIISISVNDGTADTTAHTTGVFDSTAAFQIGALAVPSAYWNGRIDEVIFWKKVLSGAEITALYNSGTGIEIVFGSNQIANAAGFNYFSVNGSTPAASDAVYFGSTDGPFRHVALRIGTAGAGTFTITWEVWTGASWVSTAGMIRESSTFITLGNRLVVMDTPTGWATTEVNGVTAYWIRARISAFTSMSTVPAQAAQVVYNPRDTYISIAADQIDGDVDALTLLRLDKYLATTNGIRLAAMGIKSRGLTAFTSRLNAGGANPTGWSEAYGTDTTEVADIESPGNSHANCTFATDQAMLTRVTLTLSTTATIEDFEGEYHAYMRVQQIGGANGAVSVRLAYGDGSLNLHAGTATLVSHDAGMELVSMGRLSIIAPRNIESSENGPSTLKFFLQASATSATPDIRFYDIILIPIDEWSYVAACDSAIVSSTLPAVNAVGDMLECDGGVIRRGATTKFGGANNNVRGFFESRGKLPQLPPDKALQLHVLFADVDSSTGQYKPNQYLGASIKAYVHERWIFMRGAE